jgi:hypothetical protein
MLLITQDLMQFHLENVGLNYLALFVCWIVLLLTTFFLSIMKLSSLLNSVCKFNQKMQDCFY